MSQQEAEQILKEKHIQATRQRITILEYFLEHKVHPGIEEVYEALADRPEKISKATVYNTVNLFEKHGLLKALDVGEAYCHYDVDMDRHGHFHCVHCGKIWNIPYDPEVEKNLPPGFEVLDEQVLVKGLCPECASENSDKLS